MENLANIKAKYSINDSSMFDADQLGQILKDMGQTPSKSELLHGLRTLKKSEANNIDFKSFQFWYESTYSCQQGATLNRLLLRDQIGKSRRSGFNLPAANHIYGKVFTKDSEGAGKVVLGWELSKPSSSKAECRDLVQMNKLATIAGCTNPSSVRSYRKGNEVLVKARVGKTRGGMNKLPKTIREKTFGQPSIPSSPISNLIKQGTQDSSGDYPIIERRSKTTPKIRSTRAARGQDIRLVGVTAKKKSNVVKSPFKLKKFEKVEARVQSNNCHGSSDLTSKVDDSAAEEKAIEIEANNIE